MINEPTDIFHGDMRWIAKSIFAHARANFHCPLEITFIRSAVHGGSYW
jgi:hypothetical protein